MRQIDQLSDEDLVRVLRALADPLRFRITQQIAAAGELSCGEVAAKFDLSQPTISHHLKMLTDAGVLAVRTQGKHRYTSVDQRLLGLVGSLLPARLKPTR